MDTHGFGFARKTLLRWMAVEFRAVWGSRLPKGRWVQFPIPIAHGRETNSNFGESKHLTPRDARSHAIEQAYYTLHSEMSRFRGMSDVRAHLDCFLLSTLANVLGYNNILILSEEA
jgi:hypothetical protein